MPRVGGIFTLAPGYKAVSGETIQPSQHNPPLEDIAQALTDSLPRDGTAGMVGPLAMGGYKITGLAAGTADSHAPRLDQVTPRSAFLLSASALSLAANEMIYASAANVAAKTVLTPFARTLLDDTDAAAARVTLGALSLGGGTLTGDLTMPRIRLTSTNDAYETSTAHAFQIGPDNGSNLIMDNNEIISRNNGVLSELYINATTFGVTATRIDLEANTEVRGVLTLNRSPNSVIKTQIGDIYFRNGSDADFAILRQNDTLSATTILKQSSADSRYTRGVTAGNGLTGGASSGPATVSMGTPSSITSTSANETTGTSHSHSLSEGAVRTLIAEGGAGNVGTYAFMRNDSGVTLLPNDTVAGAKLRYASANGDTGQTGPGAWRCMGYAQSVTDPDRSRVTLFLRIS